jgi:hypothetical protein
MAEPAKRIPQWLTIDVLVIVVSLVIIGFGVWIAPSRRSRCAYVARGGLFNRRRAIAPRFDERTGHHRA